MGEIHKIKVTAPSSHHPGSVDTYYTPIIIQDQFKNKYLAISNYEAGEIKKLLDLLHEKKELYNQVGNINAHGDWFYDLPNKIKKYLEAIK